MVGFCIMFYINKNWKNVANGHNAVCIFGGPSSKQTKNLNTIIDNNFTITVNHNIQYYPNVSMYITADNALAREYFESEEFCLFKFNGGVMLPDRAIANYDPTPIWIQGKRHILREDLIKVICCSMFPVFNHSFTTGQLAKHYGEEFCKQVPNTHLCVEWKQDDGQHWPTLSVDLPETIQRYGKDPLKIFPGGNIASLVFQLLWYMGFDNVFTTGFGDSGTSLGYNTENYFQWSNEELHSIVAHNKIWGDRLKSLEGGELCRQYCEFPVASYDELEQNQEKKKILINKLLEL